MSNLAKSFITSIFLVIIFIVFFNLDVYGNESVIVSLVFAFIIGFVYLGYSLYKVFEENNAKSKFAVYLSELITSIILFTCVFTVSIGDSDKKFHSLTFLFILAVILIIHSIYGFVRDVEKKSIKEFLTQNLKKIAIIIVSVLVVSIPITIHVLTQPLNILYHDENGGEMYVQSDCSDKYYYKLSFISQGTVTPEANAILHLLQPNIIIGNQRLPASVSGRIGEPLAFESKVRWSNKNDMFSCHSLNKLVEKGIKNGTIQLEIDERFARKLK